jgi:hypothetical protein
MKKMLFILLPLYILATGLTGCEKEEEKENIQICENLKKKNTNQSSLQGKWSFFYFAYTKDGDKIELKDVISKGYMDFVGTDSLYMEYSNQWRGKYSVVAPNSIAMQIFQMTYALPMEDEIEISDAVNRAQCYAIKDDSLFIYYHGQENKNILLLTK